MSDKEIIVGLFKRVEQRTRTNRLFADLTRGATVFLAIPLLLKAWDLFEPLRGATISIIIGAWALLFAAFVVWRITNKPPQEQAAVSVDRRAGLEDELKTALWFIENPRPSEWVDAQIHRAARNAQKLNLDALYPRIIPRTSWIPAAMVLLFVSINFLPLPWNHNWLALQAAPPFALSAKEAAIVRQAEELLRRAEKLKGSDLAQKLEEIVHQLQEGKIDAQQAADMLNRIQSQIEEGNLDLDSINDGLDQMAQGLQRSEKLQPAAEAMRNKQLTLSSEELRKLAENLDSSSPEATKEMETSLDLAAENTRPGLEELAKLFQEAAENLKTGQEQLAQESLADAAKELQAIERRLDDQQLKSLASQQIQSLKDSFTKGQPGQPGTQARAKGLGPEAGQLSDGQSQAAGERIEGDADLGSPQGQAGGGSPGGSGEGTGMAPGGNGATDSPLEGAPTSLKVKLKREKVTGMPGGGGKPQNIEEISKPERSKLDYNSVKSDLSSAQKELLNQDRIPWSYRPLIKSYLQAIRPAARDSGKK